MTRSSTTQAAPRIQGTDSLGKAYDRKKLIAWYDRHAERYDEESFVQDDQRYGGDVYRIELVARLLDTLRPKRVLDIGCGTAEPMLRFLKAGHDARGFDLSPGMIGQAKRKLASSGFPEGLAEVGDLLDPKTVGRFQPEEFDAVIANGVFPYIDDDATGHAHIAKLLAPGGWYLGAYVNQLFDMFTLNRFTMDFHHRHFIDPLPVTDEVKAALREGVRSLLSRPDEPRSIPDGARDEIFVRSHNPLALGPELERHGLVQEQMFFYKFHAFPPLLKGLSEDVRRAFMEQSRAYELERAADWRGYFLASTFLVVARKRG